VPLETVIKQVEDRKQFYDQTGVLPADFPVAVDSAHSLTVGRIGRKGKVLCSLIRSEDNHNSLRNWAAVPIELFR
jgi:hypothetical protein